MSIFQRKKLQITIISILMFICLFLTYYFHNMFHVQIVFTHMFYIPIIFAALWFKRKSFIVTGILSIFLLLTAFFVSELEFYEDMFRVVMFFFVNGVVVLLSEDIDKGRRLLEKKEEKYRSLFNLSPTYILLMDTEGIIHEINDTFSKALKMKREDLVGKSIFEIGFIPQNRHEKIRKLLKRIKEGKKVGPYETTLFGADEKEHYVKIYNKTLVENGVKSIIVVLEYLTDIKKSQDALKKSIKEKELLMKEIHHRVKNNLMIISSILSLQSKYLKDKEAKDIFKESENRAKSMALIHEHLYRSSDLKRIDITEYLKVLSLQIFRSHITPSSKIKLNFDTEDIKLDIEKAVPLGLITNELVTNAIKHAFPDGEGEITLKLKRLDDNILLEVDDNGIGFPRELNWESTSSLGLQLVKSLSEQINAKVEMISDNGTTFRLIFPEK